MADVDIQKNMMVVIILCFIIFGIIVNTRFYLQYEGDVQNSKNQILNLEIRIRRFSPARVNGGM
jgi:hypothetical protein